MARKGTTKRVNAKVKQDAFLAAYAETAHVQASCDHAEIGKTTHYRWLRTDEEYAERFEAVQRVAVNVLAEEAQRRAIHGVRKMKFHQGIPCMVPAFDEDGTRKIGEDGEEAWEPYIEHDYSDTLLMFLMKAAHPAKYNDRLMVEGRQDVNLTGSLNVSQAIEAVQQDPEYLKYLEDKAVEEAAGGVVK